MAEPISYSIKQQLATMAIILLFIFSAVSYWGANKYGQRAAQLSYDRLLTGAAFQMAENIRLQEGRVIVDLPRSAFDTLALAPDDRVFYAIDIVGGTHITGYEGLPESDNQEAAPSMEGSVGQLPVSFFEADYSGEPVRFVTVERVLKDLGVAKTVRVKIGQTLLARNGLADGISWRALQVVGGIILVALVVIMFGIWMILRPLNKLNLALGKRSPVDLKPLNLNVPQEVRPLLQTINHFMSQLASTLDGLKRYTGEAAHQIRTPLAGLKSQAQNALNEHDPELRQEQLKRVVECTDMLSSTVSQLLNRAQLAHRLRSESFNDVPLDRLIEEVCREIAVSALHQGVEVAYLGHASVVISGDLFSLKQMVRNIIENAIQYSPKNSVVEVDLRSEPDSDGPVISISDQGPGIPEEEREHVFEQFYRSPNNPRSGSGLGLAIAQEVAAHHDAHLQLKDNFPRGLTVEILFHGKATR
ncbi:sensor histidine kinase N-terminal domain-containing protein [Marinobacter alexandrii]|uniref:sensor histidine kinase n=1 Tax=Marinobacter alexandrii TaxID=2570351 RepID=UPI001FFE83F0|nr:sensor histidine kinase [Marinobacter alexandrii]MCK2148762.1 sensor histidine kinase N-terminal domain-containing protein [Marinobacter alexandrii]